MGIDWDEIRKQHEARVQWEVEQGLNPIEAMSEGERKVARKTPTGTRPAPPQKKRKYDYQEIADLYNTGLMVKQVAEKLGCNTDTVRRALNALHVERRDRGGARKKDVCDQGHIMTPENRLPKTGGCRKCKQKRDREWYRNNKGKNSGSTTMEETPS